MLIIAENRRIVKKLRDIVNFPDPMKDDENYRQFFNIDIEDMDRADLIKALREVELKLTLNDRLTQILYLERTGYVTAESWLFSRIAAIKKALRGVA